VTARRPQPRRISGPLRAITRKDVLGAGVIVLTLECGHKAIYAPNQNYVPKKHARCQTCPRQQEHGA